MPKPKKESVEITSDKDRLRAVEAAMSQIEKNHGKGSIMHLGDKTVETIPAISSVSIKIDLALGVGGFTRGRIVEIYGPESSGKTTLTSMRSLKHRNPVGLPLSLMRNTHSMQNTLKNWAST